MIVIYYDFSDLFDINGNEIIEAVHICVFIFVICNHFICEAEGEPVSETNESRNIRWIAIEELAELLKNNKSKFFTMNVDALEKYLRFNNS